MASLTGAGLFVPNVALLAKSAVFMKNQEKENIEETGSVYPGWKEGEMDLHFIYTGVGESCFHIFPDGTTMLIDAGDRNTNAYKLNVTVLPDQSRHAGEWIARYIDRVHPKANEKTIDYLQLSHFHNDHGGGPDSFAEKTSGRGNDYYLSGLTQVGEFWKFRKGFDRGWPNDNKPVPISDTECYDNFRRFIQWKVEHEELQMEQFEVGRLDQIQLQYQPEKYDFHVRNICGNGIVMKEDGSGVIDCFEKYPKNKERINENILSLGMVFAYGPFRFYTAGDVSGTLADDSGNRLNFEEMVGKAAGKVDVCKANHHSYRDAMTPEFVREVQATVYVIPVWDRLHTQDNTMTNMSSEELYAGKRTICSAQIEPEEQETFRNADWMKNVAIAGGHIVVKVFDGGRQYKVYFLTANDESMKIKTVLGPFASRCSNQSKPISQQN